MDRPAPASAGTPPIDPRIRARRIAVQRDAGRRRLRRLVDAGLLLTVAVAFAVALRSPLLDVDAVEVAGASRTAPAEVEAVAGVAPGQQLVDVDPGAVAARVAALPWVREVTVERRFDGTIRLQITEREPAALLGEGASAVVVDVEGRVLAPAAEVPDVAARLVRIDGLPGAPTPGAFLPAGSEAALEVARRVGEAVPGAIGSIGVGDDLRALLVAGGEVRFGSATDLAAKLRSLATVLEQVDLTCLGVLDLRIPASPVLTRREGCS